MDFIKSCSIQGTRDSQGKGLLNGGYFKGVQGDSKGCMLWGYVGQISLPLTWRGKDYNNQGRILFGVCFRL